MPFSDQFKKFGADPENIDIDASEAKGAEMVDENSIDEGDQTSKRLESEQDVRDRMNEESARAAEYEVSGKGGTATGFESANAERDTGYEPEPEPEYEPEPEPEYEPEPEPEAEYGPGMEM